MHRLLEEYLSQVAIQLQAIPAKQREEELREISQHLTNAAIVHHEIHRQDEDEAAIAAIGEFGPPNELAAEMLSAWRRGEKKASSRSLVGAILSTLACQSIGNSLYLPFLRSLGWPQHQDNIGAVAIYMLLWQFTATVLTGTVIGRLFPKRAIAATWVVAALQYLIVIISYHLSTLPPHEIAKAYLVHNFSAITSTLSTTLWIWLTIRWRDNRQRRGIAG